MLAISQAFLRVGLIRRRDAALKEIISISSSQVRVHFLDPAMGIFPRSLQNK